MSKIELVKWYGMCKEKSNRYVVSRALDKGGQLCRFQIASMSATAIYLSSVEYRARTIFSFLALKIMDILG